MGVRAVNCWSEYVHGPIAMNSGGWSLRTAKASGPCIGLTGPAIGVGSVCIRYVEHQKTIRREEPLNGAPGAAHAVVPQGACVEPRGTAEEPKIVAVGARD